MNEWDSGVTGIVEMLYNWLSYGVIHDGMLMYGKEASNRKQEIDRQHHTILV